MLSLTDVMYFLADELARLRGGSLPLALGLFRLLFGLLLRHRSPPSETD
jgi:hypothetical protein